MTGRSFPRSGVSGSGERMSMAVDHRRRRDQPDRSKLFCGALQCLAPSAADQMLPPGFSRQRGKSRLEQRSMVFFQEGIEQDDLEVRVELEERAQHIRLAPHAALLDTSPPSIRRGRRWSWKSTYTPGASTGSTSKTSRMTSLPILTTWVRSMNRMSFDRASGRHPAKRPERQWEQLNPTFHPRMQERSERLGIGLDAGHLHQSIEKAVDRIEGDTGRVSESDLHDATWSDCRSMK